MPTFKYRATYQGKIVNGELKAKSLQVANLKLKSKNLDPIFVVEKPLLPIFSKGSQIASTDIILMTRQLSFLLDSGISLIQSFDIVVSIIANPTLKIHIKDIAKQMQGGSSFSRALRSKPMVFDGFYVNMVICGEETGNMDTILDELATYMEKSENIKSRVKSAMWYPAAVLAISMAIVVALLVFVVPKFQEIYGSSGQELPAITQIFIDLSMALRTQWFLFLLGTFAIPFIFVQYFKTEAGAKQFQKALSSMPLFGELSYKVGLVRFTRSFYILLQSGVNFLEALDISKNISGHRQIVKGLGFTKNSVIQGKGFSKGLKGSKVFPNLVVSMSQIGEESGNLDQVFQKLTTFYDDEVDRQISSMIKLIEPLLMVFLGGIVGTVILALYLPIFNMGDVLGG